MKVPPDLMHQKAVAHELCVSLVTLWRARRCNIPGFPQPVIFRKMVFWKKSDLDRLEDALMKFEGRCKFENRRQAQQKLDRLREQARPSPKRARASANAATVQTDLFKRRP